MNSTEHFIIRKLFRFEAAHRVRDAYSVRCRGLHGHSYRVEILLSGELDSVGMLLDFKRLKETIGKTIDVFDHSLFVQDTDAELLSVASSLNSRFIIVSYNPTAENMAAHLFRACENYNLPVHSVIVHETETGYAQAFKGIDIAGVKYHEDNN